MTSDGSPAHLDEGLAAAVGVFGTTPWSSESVKALSVSQLPAQLLGEHADILLADARFLWMRWYISSLVDIEALILQKQVNYGHVYRMVVAGLRATLQGDDKTLANIGRSIARQITDAATRARRVRLRTATPVQRAKLIAVSGIPRCWICGHQFDEDAIESFMGVSQKGSSRRSLPDWVDRFKPVGMQERDLEIQVDHVHPFSDGGDDGLANLRLCCGWCNLAKGGRLGIYDGGQRARNLSMPGGRSLSVPRFIWTARLLALKGRCEHHGGCERSTAIAALSLGLRNPVGAAVPHNLMVLCDEHNQTPDRYVRRKVMNRLRTPGASSVSSVN